MYKLILAMEGEGGKLRAYTFHCNRYIEVESLLYEAQPVDDECATCNEEFDFACAACSKKRYAGHLVGGYMGEIAVTVDVIDENGREYFVVTPEWIGETYAGYALFEGGNFVESDTPNGKVRDFLDKYFHIGADDEDFD